MKIRSTVFILFWLASVLAFAQTSRDEVHIYIPMPTGGDSTQQAYFQENFTVETMAAGYSIADNAASSDYTLSLTIKPNLVWYDDGTQDLAPPDEPQYALALVLAQTHDGTEIVAFEFLFTDIDEMYDFNLYLLYQAMANVPLTKVTGVVEDDHWRNKWFYLRFSLDFNVPVYYPDPQQYSKKMDASANYDTYYPIYPLVPFAPGITLGLELQFLNWMSTELGLAVLVGDVSGTNFNYDPVVTFDVSLKFPIKPLKHFMIEPFIGTALPMALWGTNLPRIGIQGGAQVAIKAGNMGGIFFNTRAEYDFGYARTRLPDDADPPQARWSRFVIGVGVGYKIGFSNRKAD